jgi:hypothetical protein
MSDIEARHMYRRCNVNLIQLNSVAAKVKLIDVIIVMEIQC